MPAELNQPHGEVFLDARGNGRALRLTWHHDADVVVLSLWRDRVCAGTFRLSTTDVSDFVDALVEGMRDAPVDGETATGFPPVVPYTGAIDVSASAAAPKHAAEPAHDDGFVEWVLRDGDGRASA
jgi:hypothetical protein